MKLLLRDWGFRAVVALLAEGYRCEIEVRRADWSALPEGTMGDEFEVLIEKARAESKRETSQPKPGREVALVSTKLDEALLWYREMQRKQLHGGG